MNDIQDSPRPLGTPSEYTIPADINNFSRQEAAAFYANNLRWAVHPLKPSDYHHHTTTPFAPRGGGRKNHPPTTHTKAYINEETTQ